MLFSSQIFILVPGLLLMFSIFVFGVDCFGFAIFSFTFIFRSNIMSFFFFPFLCDGNLAGFVQLPNYY